MPAFYRLALYLGFEIRAYSMEMAGVAVCALLLVYTVDQPTRLRLLLLGTTCAAFLGSRYSFVFCAAALLVDLAVGLRWRGESAGAAAVRLATVALPLTLVGCGIVWITLRRQIWSEMVGGVVGIAAPAYVQGSVPGSESASPELLFSNLISLPALPITIAVVPLLLLIHARWKRRAGDCLVGEFPAGLVAL